MPEVCWRFLRLLGVSERWTKLRRVKLAHYTARILFTCTCRQNVAVCCVLRSCQFGGAAACYVMCTAAGETGGAGPAEVPLDEAGEEEEADRGEPARVAHNRTQEDPEQDPQTSQNVCMGTCARECGYTFKNARC